MTSDFGRPTVALSHSSGGGGDAEPARVAVRGNVRGAGRASRRLGAASAEGPASRHHAQCVRDTSIGNSLVTRGVVSRLRERGLVDGQNVALEIRCAEGRTERFSVFAAELVNLRVDVLVAASTPGAIAAKRATPWRGKDTTCS